MSEYNKDTSYNYNKMGIGDWGLGIAQSPIPNPQSPYTNKIYYLIQYSLLRSINYNKTINKQFEFLI